MRIHLDLPGKTEIKEFERQLRRLPGIIDKNLSLATAEYGALLKSETVRTLIIQPAEWPALSATYLQWKLDRGHDPRKLLRTHIMKQSLQFRKLAHTEDMHSGVIQVSASRFYPPRHTLSGTFSKAAARKQAYASPRSRGKRKLGTRKPVWFFGAYIHEHGLFGRPRRPLFQSTIKREKNIRMLRIYWMHFIRSFKR